MATFNEDTNTVTVNEFDVKKIKEITMSDHYEEQIATLIDERNDEVSKLPGEHEYLWLETISEEEYLERTADEDVARRCKIPLIEVHYNQPSNIADGFGVIYLNQTVVLEDPAVLPPDVSEEPMACVVLGDNLMVSVNKAMTEHLVNFFKGA